MIYWISFWSLNGNLFASATILIIKINLFIIINKNIATVASSLFKHPWTRASEEIYPGVQHFLTWKQSTAKMSDNQKSPHPLNCSTCLHMSACFRIYYPTFFYRLIISRGAVAPLAPFPTPKSVNITNSAPLSAVIYHIYNGSIKNLVQHINNNKLLTGAWRE